MESDTWNSCTRIILLEYNLTLLRSARVGHGLRLLPLRALQARAVLDDSVLHCATCAAAARTWAPGARRLGGRAMSHERAVSQHA